MAERATDVIVVGSGVIGSAAAWRLARAGHRVRLLEQFSLGHELGSSHGPSRMIRLAYEEPEYAILGREAFRLWDELQEESGEALLHLTGGLDVGTPDAHEMDGIVHTYETLGMPYERLLEEEILAPLGLERTGHESDGEIVPLLARGYEPSPASFGQARHAPFQQMATKTGGGSLVSTAADLHRWADAIGRDPILGPETWAELFPEPDFLWTGRCPGYNAALAREGEWIAVVLANRDFAYYRQNVATDRSVKECLAYIDNAREKDQEQRAERSRKKSINEPAAPKASKPAASDAAQFVK